jgi:beta-1,4-N-acetylglucosaminyltransferase
VVNGPGTCVPLCWAAFARRLFFMRAPKVVFVESFARVTRLSLSGYLLYPIVDRFVVQWPLQAQKYPYTEYLGTIC